MCAHRFRVTVTRVRRFLYRIDISEVYSGAELHVKRVYRLSARQCERAVIGWCASASVRMGCHGGVHDAE